MGIILRMLGRRPARSEWEGIVSGIPGGLERLRKDWFKTCIGILEEKRKENPAIEIMRPSLGGAAELAITAYQLYIASRFIARERYVSKRRGSEFADILYAAVCGKRFDAVFGFVQRYYEVESNAAQQLYVFCNDISGYVTGKEKATEESKLVAVTVPAFVAENMALVARSFRDVKTAEKFERKAEKERHKPARR